MRFYGHGISAPWWAWPFILVLVFMGYLILLPVRLLVGRAKSKPPPPPVPKAKPLPTLAEFREQAIADLRAGGVLTDEDVARMPKLTP
jgi:hypothetical protein